MNAPQSGPDGFHVDERGLPPGSPLRPDWELTPRDYVRRQAAGEKKATLTALPMTYYRRAIAALPADVLPVFITDDPSFVDETFADLPMVASVQIGALGSSMTSDEMS